MPRLVRRKPLVERIKAVLNPMDFLLWLSEEMETRDWDSKVAGTQLGLALNVVLLIARANYGSPAPSDDIFRDDAGSGWVSFFIYPIVWGVVLFSVVNAFYTVIRSRKYRLFEADVEVTPATPSARRVKVQSSPASGSPFRYIADLMAPEAPESRAHPDKTKDVWELSVWDPLPISLRIFCLFSPGHVLIYLLFLPLAPLDPRPSVTVFNALVVQVLLSGQLLFLTSSFTQQGKDNTIIQKEVMHEYDTKFVHPRLYPVVRDVGTQVTDRQLKNGRGLVEAGTPTTLIRHSFRTHPNPNYVSHVDADDVASVHTNVMTPQMFTPPTATRRSSALTPAVAHRPSTTRKSLPAGYIPNSASSTSVGTTTTGNPNFGGSMGIYTHNKSPLKKTISLDNMNAQDPTSPRNSREMAAYEQRNWRRESSPLKESEDRRLAGANPGGTTNPFAQTARGARPYYQHERYPSRW